MQQIIKKLLPKIALRRSMRKSELQTKEFVLTDLHVVEWLETENEVQEMAIGCGSTKANPGQKQNQVKFKQFRVVQGNIEKGMRLARFVQIQELECSVLCAKTSNVN